MGMEISAKAFITGLGIASVGGMAAGGFGSRAILGENPDYETKGKSMLTGLAMFGVGGLTAAVSEHSKPVGVIAGVALLSMGAGNFIYNVMTPQVGSA